MKNNLGTIYKIVNTANNKIYIGQTINSLRVRFHQHRKFALHPDKYPYPLYRAMSLYGRDIFKILPIEENIPKEQLDEKEKYYIKKFRSLVPNGYNISAGGGNQRFHPIREHEEEVVNLYLNGTPTKDIAKKFDVSNSTIINILNKNSIEFRPSGPMEKHRSFDLSLAIELFNNGLSYPKIGKIMGCDEKTIRRNLLSNGIKRNVSAPSDEIVSALISGKTREDVAKEFSVHIGTISRIIRRNNLQIPKAKRKH
jgi:group I intron endonuclease|nr:MAG TPA: intron associated endonuclease [Caudoviricetes sp.]